MKKIFEIKFVAAMCSALLMIAAMVVLSAQKAEANVCFLPDGEECNDGVTRGFWPGHRPDSDIEPERQSGNCDNFTDTTRRNECGQLCQVCSIAGDKNYGKYLCPSVPATGCAQACDCTLSEGAKNQKLASNPCMECEQCTSSECSEVNRGKWRCAINQACQQCQSSGYNKRYDSSEVTASNGTCSRTQCEPCSDKYNTLEAREWYKCYECDENTYTHNENNLTDEDKTKHCDMNNKCGCFVGCDCFGYNYSLNDCTSEGKEAKDECKGKGGTWYKECVCQGGVTQKKGEGQCWDYNDKCTDASGNKHYNQKENVRSGYKIEGGECVEDCPRGYVLKNGICTIGTCPPSTGKPEIECTGTDMRFTQTSTAVYIDSNGNQIRCGECKHRCVAFGQYASENTCTDANPGKTCKQVPYTGGQAPTEYCWYVESGSGGSSGGSSGQCENIRVVCVRTIAGSEYSCNNNQAKCVDWVCETTFTGDELTCKSQGTLCGIMGDGSLAQMPWNGRSSQFIESYTNNSCPWATSSCPRPGTSMSLILKSSGCANGSTTLKEGIGETADWSFSN